ncbi:hypothetical protein [Actinomadura sp. DC4]|uniref:hypothetical protein n=1 Tax=Actinomadura sp. DC4 TaxID=3055069 RepID=UPI0025AF7196|nr:hypothetical protein [Actinomadura sp. DC4]MDN3356093.1 hypothetical protein [Actinomadura sp. DC4]
MNAAVWSLLGTGASAGIAGAISFYAQRGAKALGTRKENREDFTAITERQDKEIARLNERVTNGEKREHDERRIVTVALRFIEGLTRQLRDNGLEPPPLPTELADRMWE